jgi:hypothetical protein
VFNLIACIQPIQLWHSNVKDDNLGFHLSCHPKQRPSVIDDAYDLEFGLEKVFAGLG